LYYHLLGHSKNVYDDDDDEQSFLCLIGTHTQFNFMLPCGEVDMKHSNFVIFYCTHISNGRFARLSVSYFLGKDIEQHDESFNHL